MIPAPTPAPDTAADPLDHRLALRATGLLRQFNQAGVLDAADVHVATRLCAARDETDDRVALAVALAVRAVRGGSVCVDLATVADDVVPADAGSGAEGSTEPEALPWPEAGDWYAALAASPLLGSPDDGTATVLRLLEDRLVYLDRYWREEAQVCADLLDRPALPDLDAERAAALEAGLLRVLRDDADHAWHEQRDAARTALRHRTTVLTGGPGTGKTTTVAALLALLHEQAALEPGSGGRSRLRVALAAPTGKAAARLQEAVAEQVRDHLDPVDRERVGEPRALTLHRLLGVLPDSSSRYRHHRENRLPHDVVVVDETSMVSLTMMARLLEAVRPTTRLVLVGDPDQLTSVEAGAVLGDLVEGLAGEPGGEPDGAGDRGPGDGGPAGGGPVVAALRTPHRYVPEIGDLAEAVRRGDADEAVRLLSAGGDHLRLVDDEDPAPAVRDLVLPRARDLVVAAEAGRASDALARLGDQRLLCAHREGRFGVRHWNQQVERWLAEVTGESVWSAWYPGRPLLVTANDYGLGVYNGDAGVAVRGPDGGLRAAVAGTTGELDLAPSRLGDVETMHAMTIHKAQGSQAGEVVVVLPPPESRLLTRELFYTALTRAQRRVVVVGSPDDVRAAVGRRAVRATGLRRRLAAARAR